MINLSKDRLTLVVAGAVAALAIGLILALLLRGVMKPHVKPAEGAGPAGLVVQSAEPGKIGVADNLRCFVNGQMVGQLTLADCAQRNGVAAGALDVGIDANGQLGAATDAGTALTPLPPSNPAAPPETAVAPAIAPAPAQAAAPAAPAAAQRVAATGTCWRYDSNTWFRVPGDQSLNSCVQTLFAGRCEKIGGALYGRWGDQTLRLIPGQVQISADNRSFRSLASQGADCSLGTVPAEG